MKNIFSDMVFVIEIMLKIMNESFCNFSCKYDLIKKEIVIFQERAASYSQSRYVIMRVEIKIVFGRNYNMGETQLSGRRFAFK